MYVTRDANVRSDANTNSRITRGIVCGSRVSVQPFVTGQEVYGNNKWAETNQGDYIWSGLLSNSSVRCEVIVPTPVPTAVPTIVESYDTESVAESLNECAYAVIEAQLVSRDNYEEAVNVCLNVVICTVTELLDDVDMSDDSIDQIMESCLLDEFSTANL